MIDSIARVNDAIWPFGAWVIANYDIPRLNITKGYKFRNKNSDGHLSADNTIIDSSFYNLFALTSNFNITDSVTVINDKYSNDVRKGQVGTIVEVFGKDNDIYEVEFCDKDGKTLVSCAIAEEDLLRLYFD